MITLPMITSLLPLGACENLPRNRAVSPAIALCPPLPPPCRGLPREPGLPLRCPALPGERLYAVALLQGGRKEVWREAGCAAEAGGVR